MKQEEKNKHEITIVKFISMGLSSMEWNLKCKMMVLVLYLKVPFYLGLLSITALPIVRGDSPRYLDYCTCD
jgi:hypothetical protein